MTSFSTIAESAAALREKLGERKPAVAFVLGSALGAFSESVDDPLTFSFGDVPNLRHPKVVGHKGLVTAGTVGGVQVIVLAGRVHGYEGYTPEEVTRPVRVLAAVGVDAIVLTNSAGGIDPTYRAGDLMIIDDHLNLTGENPLRGPNDERLGPRFPDMTHAYDRKLVSALEKASLSLGRPVHRGVYAGVAGPSYETPAEIRMLRTLGASAVGMSTVHEAIVARHSGLRVAGVSVITNPAAGVGCGTLDHDDVLREGELAATRLAELLRGFCLLIENGA
ncbi:MAG TPA: purine-nucleoside phosphorylase [Blastocatellia bacterium]|nr:purine-nucleoside phosphorylase [Blastocatellia bacterium]